MNIIFNSSALYLFSVNWWDVFYISHNWMPRERSAYWASSLASSVCTASFSLHSLFLVLSLKPDSHRHCLSIMWTLAWVCSFLCCSSNTWASAVSVLAFFRPWSKSPTCQWCAAPMLQKAYVCTSWLSPLSRRVRRWTFASHHPLVSPPIEPLGEAAAGFIKWHWGKNMTAQCCQILHVFFW